MPELNLQRSVSQYGITWTFEQPRPVGRFVNGDYYVVGSVTVAGIDPAPKDGRNGSVLNVPLNGRLGFDSRASWSPQVPRANRFDAEQFRKPPIALKPGDCLLSSISVDEVGKSARMLEPRWQVASPVMTVAALTCLAEAVPRDAFRPSYADRQQRIYLASDLRRDLLPRLPLVDVARGRPRENVLFRVGLGRCDPTCLANWERVFQRPWIDTTLDQLMNPVENMPNYGREVARAAGIATLLLCSDFPPEEKEKLLVNVVQVGIDLWGLVRAGYHGWPALGGHGIGRKWLIVFSGIMLGDREMQSPKAAYPDVLFGEDMQTMYDTCWTGANVVYAGHLGTKDGKRREGPRGAYEHLHPSEWEARVGESYRRCCTSIAWVAEALAIRIMHAERLWDHDAFLDYVDRWMTEDDSEHVQAIEEAKGWDFSAEHLRQGKTWDKWVDAMWAAYRNNLSPASDAANREVER